MRCCRDLVVAGGVAANQYIRGQLSDLCVAQSLRLVLPPPRWCTDNGVMVAWAGHERLRLGLAEPPAPPLPQQPQHPPRQQQLPLPQQQQEQQQPQQQPSGDVGVPSAREAGGGGSGHASGAGASATAAVSTTGDEWVELRPRWPLTGARHPKCVAGEQRSAKKARMSASLSDVTAQQLAALRARGAGAAPAGP
eukprot:356823-Chlamydomonas_euryale.AAC.3